MATAVIMPRQGNTVESCIITKWHKKPGDSVKAGDSLFSYETDKASFDEDAKAEGVLLAVFFQEGDDVPCLSNVCVIGGAGEDASAFAPGQTTGQVAEAPSPAPAPQTTAQVTASQPTGRISPRARRLAEDRGADLSRVVATGPSGRVIERDVYALIDAGLVVTPAARSEYQGGTTGTGIGGRVTLSDIAPVTAPAAEAAATPAVQPVSEPDSWTEPLPNIRKVISRAMTMSLSTMAQLTHTISFDATQIQSLRAQFKAAGEESGMSRITLNDIVMYAVARTLAQPEYRALNANLVDNGSTMKYYRAVNLGMACDTERGLVVPKIFGADKLSLKELSDEAKRLAKSCKEGKIDPDTLKNGSFTVSNLGSYGIESFTPVINPPETGILGVCAITTRVREENGAAVCYPAMTLCLTYDHRALDGSPASRFLKALAYNLEHFTLLLARG